MVRLQLDDVTNALKEATYVSVGFGVLAFQRLQLRRNELRRTVSAQAGTARSALDVVGSALADQAKVVEERLGAALDRPGR